MGDLEERLLLSSLRQPLSLFRFIDDVDMKWKHDDKELDEFLEHANSIHPSIKFPHEVSKTKMSFLDTTTTVMEGNMTTDLYSKPTDKHQYLSLSENKGNPFVDLFFFVLQEVISVNFTGF
jgi:hypothetical protein